MENKPLTERERIDALVFRIGISIRQLAVHLSELVGKKSSVPHNSDWNEFWSDEVPKIDSCSDIAFLTGYSSVF